MWILGWRLPLYKVKPNAFVFPMTFFWKKYERRKEKKERIIKKIEQLLHNKWAKFRIVIFHQEWWSEAVHFCIYLCLWIFFVLWAKFHFQKSLLILLFISLEICTIYFVIKNKHGSQLYSGSHKWKGSPIYFLFITVCTVSSIIPQQTSPAMLTQMLLITDSSYTRIFLFTAEL